MGRFKCSEEDYGVLQRLRNQVISVKIEYRHLEEARDYVLQAKRFETAELLTGMMKRRHEDIRQLEKEVAELESACLVGKE